MKINELILIFFLSVCASVSRAEISRIEYDTVIFYGMPDFVIYGDIEILTVEQVWGEFCKQLPFEEQPHGPFNRYSIYGACKGKPGNYQEIAATYTYRPLDIWIPLDAFTYDGQGILIGGGEGTAPLYGDNITKLGLNECPTGAVLRNGLCTKELQCTCNELKNAATNTCEPMAQQTEIDLTTGLVYAYPDNNHDDADRCPPILAVPESDNVCPASPQQSNASVGNNSASTGFPINCATGQKQYTDVDYQGFGLDALAYTRTYSTPNVNEPAIDGSANRAAQWLSQSAPALAKWTFDDGAELYTFESGQGMKRVFFKAANSSAWQTNGLMTPIELSFDNNQPTVQLANDQRIRFRDDLTALALQDAQGTERFVYTYTTVNGKQKISRVANRFGRYLDYSYNTAGQLVALTDQDDVSVQYAYDNAGRLIKVIYPDATPLDVSDNPSKTYLYEHPTFTDYVTGIVNQDGTRLANIAYDASGKATLSELHNGAERVEVSYPEDGKAVVKFYRDTAANAYREEYYQYGKFRGRYRLTQKQITQCDNCALTTESWLYNDRELLTRHTSPEGIVTEYGYDTQDRKVSETHGAGTPEASTTTYTWNDTHNQIETVTTATEITTYSFDADGKLVTADINSID